MEEWKEYRLGEIVELKNGIAFKSSEFITDGIPVIKIKNVKPNNILLDDLSYVSEESSKNKKCFWIKPSDILITMTGNRKDGGADSWVGKVALFRKEGRYLLNQRVGAIRIKDTDLIDYKYLAYLLSSWDSQLYFVNHSNSSGGQANISPSVVNDYLISLPSLPTQQKIASILSSLDDKIEVNRRINEQLEELAQALFKSWFVDFEPFKDSEFVESELGMIPKGWKVGELSDIGEIVGGATPSKANAEYYTQDGISWITPKDLSINKNKFIDKGETDITELGYSKCSAKLMPKGAVLFSSRAPIGYIAIAKKELCTNQGFKSIVPKVAGTVFIYFYLKNNISNIESMASGSTFKEASGSLIKSLKVIVPPIDLLRKFEERVSSVFEKQELLEEEITHLTTLRDTLLPKLMSGEIDVNEVNI